MKRLPIDQVRALVTWEDFHGRFWKTRLRQAWGSGDYGYFHMKDTAAALQRLRNENPNFINQQFSMDDLRAQLHHHDLGKAARVLIDQLAKGDGHYYSTPRLNVEALLLQHPDSYDGTLAVGHPDQLPPAKGWA